MAPFAPEQEKSWPQPTENEEQPTRKEALPAPLEGRGGLGARGSRRWASMAESPSQAPEWGGGVVTFPPGVRNF